MTSGKDSEAENLGSENAARLMTVKEVAAVLRVYTATVYSMIERGELENVRVSHAIRVVLK
jgi:excisionase family DNA binding protein